MAKAPNGTRAKWVAEQQGLHFCQCGCGTPIKVAAHHVDRGIPRYVSGHNVRGQKRSPETRQKLREQKLGERNPQYGKPAWNRKPPEPRTPCKCGCGELAGPGKAFVSGHNTRLAKHRRQPGPGAKAGNHLRRVVAGHPFAYSSGYVPVHRLVLEEHLRSTAPEHPHLTRVDGKLYLSPEFVVHHIDGNGTNNTIENLVSMTRDEHTALHHAQGDIRG